MFDIKLPTLNWFMFKNVYTGSLRTDPTKPMLMCTTFNYKVRVIEIKTGVKLMAMYWFELPWNHVTNIFEATAGEFDASDFGIDQCHFNCRGYVRNARSVPAHCRRGCGF